MLGNHSLSGLMKWLSHEEWREPFAETLDLHIGPACDDSGPPPPPKEGAPQSGYPHASKHRRHRSETRCSNPSGSSGCSFLR